MGVLGAAPSSPHICAPGEEAASDHGQAGRLQEGDAWGQDDKPALA